MMATKMSGGSDVDPYKGEREGKLREVGGQAVWSLSSCKPGILFIFLSLKPVMLTLAKSGLIYSVKSSSQKHVCENI